LRSWSACWAKSHASFTAPAPCTLRLGQPQTLTSRFRFSVFCLSMTWVCCTIRGGSAPYAWAPISQRLRSA
jgi:hypothetical protein